MSNDSPAPLRVVLLGPLREQLGRESAEIAFPDDGTQASFWKNFSEQFPALAPKGLRLARGNEFLDAAEHLHAGDELALIPPVSGG